MMEVIEFIEVRRRELGGTWTIVDRIVGSDQPLNDGVATYRPVAIARGSIEASQENEREDIKITLPHDDDVSRLFTPRHPDRSLRLKIQRATEITRGATGVTADAFQTIYIGTVVSARFSGSRCELTLRPPHRLLDEPGPRQRYQRQCRWDLYGPGCGVNKAAFEETGTAVVTTDPDPLSYEDYVFSDAFGGGLSTGYLNGGTLVLKGQYVRQIVSHVATASASAPNKPYVRLVSPFPVEIEHGDGLVAHPGCKHSNTDCRDKFSNVANFGGFAHIARDNPFRKSIAGGVE